MAKLDDEHLLRAIGAIYDAAVDSERWGAALAAIADAVGSPTATFDSVDHRSRRQHAHALHGVDPDWIVLWEREISEHNYLARRMVPFVSSGAVIDARELTTRDEWSRSVYFNEAFRPNGIGQVVGLVVAADQQACTEMSICSALGRDFEPRQVAFLAALVPHLQRAFEVHRRLGLAEDTARLARETLDRLPNAVIEVDGRGRVRQANLAAERLLRRRERLRVKAGALAAVGPDRPRLEAAIERATPLHGRGDASSLALRRGVGECPLQVSVLPLPGAIDDSIRRPFARESRALVVVRDPEAEAPPVAGLLRELYRLTPAEARVAELLGQGLDPTECAARLAISRDTVRNHLKSIRAKFGVRRLSEVVREISALASSLL